MAIAPDDDIWPIVRTHPWKYQAGRLDVVGIIWHATRSGQAHFDVETEYGATLNWFKSPNNAVLDSAGNKWYGGMSSYTVGAGRLCRNVPEELVPRFSAGIHDFRAISVEVAQPLNDMAYDPRDIELCHRLAADLSDRYGFPLGRIMSVDANNRGWPGEVGHEDTAQGRGQGKTDPGAQFWSQYLEEDMAYLTDEEQKLLLLRLFAGSERTDMSDADRLALARTELAKGSTVQSVNDVALSAIAVALDAHPGVDSSAPEIQAKVAAAFEAASQAAKAVLGVP